MFDAWTKFQSGVLYGNEIDFGNYDQCMEFKYDSNDTEIGLIRGKHCMIFYHSTPNVTVPEPVEGTFDWSDM